MNSLHSVASISGTRAFTQFSWEGSPARKYNLVYGWNGAGKSTVARILSFFENRKIHLDEFEGVEFRLRTDDGILTERDLSADKLNVRVFNEESVRRNLLFDASAANPIVILGESTVEASKEIRALQQQIEEARSDREALQLARDKIGDLSKVLTDCGTAVVKEFAGTSLATDRYYGRSYNRSRVQRLIDNGTISGASVTSLVIENSAVVQALREQIASRHSEVSFREPVLSTLENVFDQGNALLRHTVTVRTIEKLENDDELREWVKEGYRLHQERSHPLCYFCTNPLPPDLLARYGAFFTEEVAKTEAEIKDVVLRLEEVERELQRPLPDSGQFFADIASEYVEIKAENEANSSVVLEACRLLRTRLEHRLGRVQIAASEGQEVPFPGEEVARLVAGFAQIAELCREQTRRLEGSRKEVMEAARRLERHIVASRLMAADYFKRKAQCESLEAQIDALDRKIRSCEEAIPNKRAAMRDIALAVEEINSLVAEFLGPGEIELVVPSNDNVGEYRVTRRGELTRYLSEGEKSVVALAYFLVKLREEGCDPEETVVVLDDPVDSQDSVFLFRTYGLLKRRLQKVGQLFVFTHNHEFFNLVRDWLSSSTYHESSRLYWIEMKRKDGNRRVVISDLPGLLRDHKSEYQYLFYRLYARQNNVEMLDDPLVPNVARKVLEYFAGFKWSCRSSDDFSNIVLNRFIKSADRRESGVGDAVYKFINEYSHGNDFERPVTSAVMEAASICENILQFIYMSDQEHYNHLVQKCRKHMEDAQAKPLLAART